MRTSVGRRIGPGPAPGHEGNSADRIGGQPRAPDWFAINCMGRRAPTPAACFDRGALVVSAAAQGLGLALETQRFLEAELASGEFVILGQFRPIRPVLHRLMTRTGYARSGLGCCMRPG